MRVERHVEIEERHHPLERSTGMHRLLVLMLAALALLVIACDAGEASAPSPTPTQGPVATPTVTPHPDRPPVASARRSGDAAIDTVIEAVAARDVPALAARARMQDVACTTAEGLGGPPKCERGDPGGTVYTVFPWAGCEGAWSRNPAAILGRFAESARGLYAVLQAPDEPDAEPYWPMGDTWLVFHFAPAAHPQGGLIVMGEGEIVRVSFICAASPPEVAEWRGAPLSVLAGPFEDAEPAAPRAGDWTSIAPVDAVIEAVEAYDIAVLIGRTRLAQAACVEQVGHAAEVACNPQKSERPGDPVAVLPIAYCHGVLERDLLAAYESLLGGAPQLHAVLEAPNDAPDQGIWLAGTYWVVFELGARPWAPSVRLTLDEDGRVVNHWYGCDGSLDQQTTYEGRPLRELYREPRS